MRSRAPFCVRRARKPQGFTLIEMVVATTVLAVGVSGALATFGAISRASGVSAEYDQASLLAERRMAELESEIAAGQPLQADSGDFGEDYPDYRWEQEVNPTDMDSLVELDLTVRWGSENSPRTVVISTYLPASDTQGSAATDGATGTTP